MLFNSYIFLLGFLPITWCVYFGLNRLGVFRLAQAALVAASFLFYGYQDMRLCLLLIVSITANYLLHLGLMRQGPGPKVRCVMLAAGLLVNFSLLFYFKYVDFTIRNINLLTGGSIALRHIALPLGISFYTFQQVSFVVDSYRREMKKYSLLDYALFVSFFPQLVAGPIVLHSEMIPQFGDQSRKKINYGNITSGLEYLILGLSKKVLLADTFGRISDVGYGAVGQLNCLSAAAVILSYTLEIYFDFSGYCDMAIGLGRLFNIDIPINFRSPYKAVNISDFWKRWHITLTRFLTTYIYIPLGGNRRGKLRTYLNVMIVFTVSGLWHGADWTFVLWGMMHGAMLVLYRMNREKADRMPRWLGWLLTFGFVNAAWVFFRADSLIQPFKLYYTLIFGGGGGFLPGVVDAVCLKSAGTVLAARFLGEGIVGILSQITVGAWLAGGTALCALAPSAHEVVASKCRRKAYFAALAFLFVWSVTRLSDVSKFIYFNF